LPRITLAVLVVAVAPVDSEDTLNEVSTRTSWRTVTTLFRTGIGHWPTFQSAVGFDTAKGWGLVEKSRRSHGT